MAGVSQFAISPPGPRQPRKVGVEKRSVSSGRLLPGRNGGLSPNSVHSLKLVGLPDPAFSTLHSASAHDGDKVGAMPRLSIRWLSWETCLVTSSAAPAPASSVSASSVSAATTAAAAPAVALGRSIKRLKRSTG